MSKAYPGWTPRSLKNPLPFHDDEKESLRREWEGGPNHQYLLHPKVEQRFCGRCGGVWKRAKEDKNRCFQCFAPRHESVIIEADSIDVRLGSGHRPAEFYLAPPSEVHEAIEEDFYVDADGNFKQTRPRGKLLESSLAKNRKEWRDIQARRRRHE